MKKSVKTTLAVALVLLITGLGLLAWSASAHGGLRGLWDGAAVNLNWVSSGSGDLRGYTVCQSGEESFDPAAVKRLDLGWVAGSVKLQPGGAEITVKERCSEPLREDQKRCWKLENGTLSLRFCSALHTAMPGKELELSFPASWLPERAEIAATSADLELLGLRAADELSVVTTSGDALLKGCGSLDLTVSATSGGIDLQGCECGRLTLGSTSGALRAEDCRCDTLDAGSTSGDIRVVRCEAKTISVGSTSGSVRCEGVPAGCGVSIGTTSGEVRLSLLDTRNEQKIAVETTSGDVYLDVPGAMELDYDTASGDLSGKLEQGGSGCPKVEIDTTSGDLILGAFD